MNISILYGTETGNSAMVAEDIAASLPAPSVVNDLAESAPTIFVPGDLHIIVCSSYDDGDLPFPVQQFVDSLLESAADLSGVRYAIFIMGDSEYGDSYGKGPLILDAALASMGAERVGEFGHHDASSGDDASTLALDWADKVLAEVGVSV